MPLDGGKILMQANILLQVLKGLPGLVVVVLPPDEEVPLAGLGLALPVTHNSVHGVFPGCCGGSPGRPLLRPWGESSR